MEPTYNGRGQENAAEEKTACPGGSNAKEPVRSGAPRSGRQYIEQDFSAQANQPAEQADTVRKARPARKVRTRSSWERRVRRISRWAKECGKKARSAAAAAREKLGAAAVACREKLGGAAVAAREKLGPAAAAVRKKLGRAVSLCREKLGPVMAAAR